MTRFFALIAVAALAAGSAAAKDPLVRKAALGVALAPAEGGARIASVAPDLTGAKAGLKEGDVVTALNGAPVKDVGSLVVAAGKIRAGEKVRIDYVRAGAASSGETTAIARPFETYEGATAVYGEVAFRGGVLRDLYVAPTGAPKDGPVVYFIQGVSCSTVEGATPDHPVRALVQGLAARGIATYRVEKAGMGDSAGELRCADTDFQTELDAFRAGLKTLIGTHKIDPSRIVLFGHSMGGVEAPLLGAEYGGRLRGIAVMGTVLRNWRDYLGEVFWIQPFYAANADPVETTEGGRAMRGLLDRIFIDKVPLEAIAAAGGPDAKLLADELGFDGKANIMGRRADYWTGVAERDLPKAWRDAKAPTLALYGESDFAALDDRDHRLIVDIVNHYRPGTAHFAALARTGHPFTLDGTRAEAAAANEKAGGATGAPLGPYNAEMTRIVADWVLSLPAPVR